MVWEIMPTEPVIVCYQSRKTVNVTGPVLEPNHWGCFWK